MLMLAGFFFVACSSVTYSSVVGSSSSSSSNSVNRGISSISNNNSDLVWREDPRAWHQQLARIVDYRFDSFTNLKNFARTQKKAGVGALMLVQIQKSQACPGSWYNGLQLCDHINGSMPVDTNVTLDEWQSLVQELKPMRLMWWTNPTYWSVQGEVWAQAKADRASDVGNFFTWNVTQEDQCFGTNPEGEDGIQAQGSWQSEGAFKGVQSAMASFGSPHYADYLVDSFANSWTKNIGIDGYTIDCSANYPAAAGNKQCPNGMLQCEGDAQGKFADIIERVREIQPQVVLSGEGYGSWDEVLHAKADMGGQGFEGYHYDFMNAVTTGDASNLEDTASTSGSDAATVLCYLNPQLDGHQPGKCPTMYFRDTNAILPTLKMHEMWIALEAGSGIVSEHDYDPNSYCTHAYNGCSSYGKGAWWNVTSDPSDANTSATSPLILFQSHRALNRLALRTKVDVFEHSTLRDTNLGQSYQSTHTPDLNNLSGNLLSTSTDIHYTKYVGQNCYDGHGGIEIDADPLTGLTISQCQDRCTNTSDNADISKQHQCDCVVYSNGDCWRRALCDPTKFENDSASKPYSVYVKSGGPPPIPPKAGGALVYLKHDSMGPHGDACLMVFNPSSSSLRLTVDLASHLPKALLNGSITPTNLLDDTNNGSSSVSEATGSVPPLAENWTVDIAAQTFQFFGGFQMGVFAPRFGKRSNCFADDGYSMLSKASNDARCENVFVDYIDIDYMETPGPITCKLLGNIKSPDANCVDGDGTLITYLPDGRPIG